MKGLKKMGNFKRYNLLPMINEKPQFYRQIISWIGNGIYSVLLGKKAPVNQIFRLYKTEDLKNLNLTSKGFDINAEIFFKLDMCGKKFKQVYIPLTKRKYGKSKLNYPKEILRHLLLVLKIITWKMNFFQTKTNFRAKNKPLKT